jgi:hypothetical protein
MILAAIPPLTRCFSNLLYGHYRRPFTGWSWPVVGNDLLLTCVLYGLNLASALALGMALNLLAPPFSSRRDRRRAQTLAQYGLTPFWLGGIFYLAPQWGWLLDGLAGLYSLRVLYAGAASGAMDPPPRKPAGYVLSAGAVFIVLYAGSKLLLILWLGLRGGF